MLNTPMRALRRVLLPFLCAVLVLTPSVRAAGPLPAQLSDLEFWQLVTLASEDGGGFISENFVSNELGYPYVIPALIERVRPGGAYMGVGPEQNFTYVVATRPQIAFILDIRRQNMIEHLLYKAVFELSSNRKEFLSRLFAREPVGAVSKGATPEELFSAFASAPPDPAFHQASLDAVKNLLMKKHQFALTPEDESTLEHVYKQFAEQGPEIRYSVSSLSYPYRMNVVELPTGDVRVVTGPVPPDTRVLTGVALNLALGMQFPSYADVMKATEPNGKSWSYLATEENYLSVREMQQKNLIVPLVGDFAGPKAIRAVGQYLKDHEATVSTFYISNVEQYLTPFLKLQTFYTNVATLPLSPTSTFIRSAQVQGVQPGLAQSSLGSIQTAMDAVLEGRAVNWSDILLLPNPR
jgi:hypothetical protein